MKFMLPIFTAGLLAWLIPLAASAEKDKDTQEAVQSTKEKPERDIKTEQLTTEKNRIAAENQLREEKTKHSMAELLEEKQRLEIGNSLEAERHKKNSAAINAKAQQLKLEQENAEKQFKLGIQKLHEEKETLGLQNAISQEKQTMLRAALNAEIEQLKLEMEKQKQVQAKNLCGIEAQKDALSLENLLVAEQYKQATANLQNENMRMKLEIEKREILLNETIQEINAEKETLNAENAKLTALIQNMNLKFQIQQDEITQKLADLESSINLRETKDNWQSQVHRDIEYKKQPFKDGVLTISDRRIPLNDAIVEGTADFITKRIHYFNNQSTEDPIFIVIDRSPGGSVMEGYRILKGMEESEAPVHVVVKSFAASMAATIATIAERSYAYPNAIFLHHQPFSVAFGNITQQDEQLQIFKEWAKRLHTPVAKKMKISLDEFYKRMYEKNSDGDWQEFGDEACKLRWVNNVVTEIREEGYTKKPTDEPPRPIWFYLSAKEGAADPKNDYMLLPRLKPFDCYFIYNPNNHYRWPQ